MDPGAWAAYGQPVYSRLGAAGVNQSGHQLNDLSSGYGATGPPPPPLLLSHHHPGLNVSQAGHHVGDPGAASFVNSTCLLPSNYDQMISSFGGTSKGHHLTPLNVSPHGAGLYKAMAAAAVSKEPEMGDHLRGGFVRRSSMSSVGPMSGSTHHDPTNMSVMPGSSGSGLFNPQTPPAHSWRHSNMMPTATSPFGVLPHEDVMPRGSVSDSMDKLHSQVDHRSKSSRIMMDTRSYMEQEMAAAAAAAAAHNYRAVLSQSRVDPNAGSRSTSLMMQQPPSDLASSDLALQGIKSSDYAAQLYSNSNVQARAGLLAAQNYMPQSHHFPQDLQTDKRDLYDISLLGAAAAAAANELPKVDGYGGGGVGAGLNSVGSSKSHFDLIGNSMPGGNGSPVTNQRGSSGSQRGGSSGSGGNAQSAPTHSSRHQMVTTQPQQSRTTPLASAYGGNYVNSSTVPTYSQNYHQVSPLPSPSHSIHSPAHYSPASAAVDFSSNLSSSSSTHGPPTPVPGSHYPHTTSVLPVAAVHNDGSPGVIYSSVITRTNMPVSSYAASVASTSVAPHKKHQQNEGVPKVGAATPTPPLHPHTAQPPLHSSYDSVIGPPTGMPPNDNCMGRGDNMTVANTNHHNVAANLSHRGPPSMGARGNDGMTPMVEHGLMHSPHSMPPGVRSAQALDQVGASPKPNPMNMENVFNPQQMTFQDLAEMSSSSDKMDLEAGLLPPHSHPPHPTHPSHPAHLAQSQHVGKHEESHLMDLSQPPQQQQHYSSNMADPNLLMDDDKSKKKKKRVRRTKKQIAEDAAAAAAAATAAAAALSNASLVSTNGTTAASVAPQNRHHHHHRHHHHQQQQHQQQQMPMMRPGVGISPSSQVMNSPMCPTPEHQMYSPPTHSSPSTTTVIPQIPPPSPCAPNVVDSSMYPIIMPPNNLSYHNPQQQQQLHHHHHQQQQQQQHHYQQQHHHQHQQQQPHNLGDDDSRRGYCQQEQHQQQHQQQQMIMSEVQTTSQHQQQQQGVIAGGSNDISSTPSPLSSFDPMSFEPIVPQEHSKAALDDVKLSPDPAPIEFPPFGSQDTGQKCEKRGPTIEDDLGFLAELPPVCNVSSDGRSTGAGISASSTSSTPCASTGGNFIDSFLKFLKNTESTAPTECTEIIGSSTGGASAAGHAAATQKPSSRGRGAKSRETYTSPPQGRNVELNPVTGLFTCTDRGRGRGACRGGGGGGRGRAGGAGSISNSLTIAKSPGPSYGRASKSKTTSRKYDVTAVAASSSTSSFAAAGKSLAVTEPDAFTFSSDNDDEDLGNKGFVDSVNMALKSLTDQSTISPSKSGAANNDQHQFDFSPTKRLIYGPNNSIRSGQKSNLDTPTSFCEAIELSARKCNKEMDDKTSKKRVRDVEKIPEGTFRDSNLHPTSQLGEKLGDSIKDGNWNPFVKDGAMGKQASSDSDDQAINKRSQSLRGRRRGRGGPHIPALPRVTTNAVSKKPRLEDNVHHEVFLKEQRKRGRPKERDATQSLDRRLENACGFRPGDFIILSSDKSQANAPIWRIDGHSLLQKFEPFKDGNKTLYKGLASYSRFSLGSKALYEPIIVHGVKSAQSSVVVVEYLKDLHASSLMESDGSEKDETVAQRENFEVYLQTLISQALDPNFISEIVKENDEYFLTHVHEIDGIVVAKKSQLFKCIQWASQLKDYVESYPLLTVRPYSSEGGQRLSCQTCAKDFIMLRKVSFDGQLYNYMTLCPVTDNSRKLDRKEFLLCTNCSDIVQAYSHMHHQKYNLFTMCANKVNSIKSSDPSHESHVILEHCLQDSMWINKLFFKIKNIWSTCSVLCR